MIDTRDLTGPRWSSAVQCPRRAVYEGIGAPADPYSEETLALFRRGRILGAMVTTDLSEQLREAGRTVGQAELEIPWPPERPVGVGHADYYMPDETRIIEWLSSREAVLPAHKALQAAGYAIFHPEATCATVLIVDPSTLSETRFDLEIDGLADEVIRVSAEVVAGMVNGVLPDRPEGVETPNDWLCHDCPFRRACWTSWEPWPVGNLPESLHADVLALADLTDQIARQKKVAALEEQRDEIRARLEGGMVEGARYQAPGIASIHYTRVPGRRSFSISNFEAAGHALPPDVEAFVTESDGHTRWTIRREEP